MNDWLLEDGAPATRLPLYASSFAKRASGSSSDDDDDDDSDDDDDDDDSDDDDDDDPDADKTDEELRDELKRTREALQKANGSSAKRRKALRQKEAELEEERRKKRTPPAKKDGDAPDPIDVEALREEAKREGEKAGIDRAKRSEARAALVDAGVPKDRLDRALRQIDLDDLELDDDGLDGIDDAIADLKREIPEFFGKTRRRRESVAGDGDRGGDRPARAKKMTASERQAAMVTGRGR